MTENICSNNNVKGLRCLFDTVETQVRGLSALGSSAEFYGGMPFLFADLQIAT